MTADSISESGSGEVLFERQIERSTYQDHQFQQEVVFPGVGYIDLGLASGKAGQQWTLSELSVEQPLLLTANSQYRLRAVGRREADSAYDVEFQSQSIETTTQPWVRHARGRLQAVEASESRLDLNELKSLCRTEMTSDEFYKQQLVAIGFNYGPHFRRIQNLWRGDGANGSVVILAQLNTEDFREGWSDHRLPSGLLDSCIQPLFAVLAQDSRSRMLSYMDGIKQHADFDRAAWSCVTINQLPTDRGDLVGRVDVVDSEGVVVFELGEVRLRLTETTDAVTQSTTATTSSDTVPSQDAAPSEDASALATVIEEVVADVLEFDPGTEIDHTQYLSELGVDSLLAIDLSTALSERFSHKMPRTLVFDCPTIADLTEHIAALGLSAA